MSKKGRRRKRFGTWLLPPSRSATSLQACSSLMHTQTLLPPEKEKKHPQTVRSLRFKEVGQTAARKREERTISSRRRWPTRRGMVGARPGLQFSARHLKPDTGYRWPTRDTGQTAIRHGIHAKIQRTLVDESQTVLQPGDKLACIFFIK